MKKEKTKLRVIELTQTCNACPSQWEGRTVDYKRIYIRYRWGHLSVQLYCDPNEVETIFSGDYGEGFSGVLETNRMMRLTRKYIWWDL